MPQDGAVAHVHPDQWATLVCVLHDLRVDRPGGEHPSDPGVTNRARRGGERGGREHPGEVAGASVPRSAMKLCDS